MTFAVEQEAFSGPLGLLLELLDQRKLEIKDVHLVKIADDYIAYMGHQEIPPEEIADFLLVASRLIYLKSKELMPYLRIDDEEEGVATLEDQLRLYKMFTEAADQLQNTFSAVPKMSSRPYVKIPGQKVEGFQSSGVTIDQLLDAFGALLKKLEPFFVLQQASMERVKSVEERIEEMKGAILTRSKVQFKEVIVGATSRAEVVVSFLALLELVRRNIVQATQSAGNDIDIQKI